MPLGGLVTAGALVTSGALGFAGANKAAGAQQSAAQLQYQSSQNAITAQQASQAYAVQLAQATPQELGLINQQISTQTASYNQQMAAIQQDYSTLQSATPEIQSAGKEANQLLQGQQAAILAPIQNQRNLQLTQLQNQLQAQLGSGYATSSVGQKALLQFNLQTQDLMTQAQNQTLTTLAGISLQGQGLASQIASRQSQISSQFLATPLQAVQNIQNRIVGAQTQNQPAYVQAALGGTQGAMQAAGSAGGGLNSLSNTFATGASVVNSQANTASLLNAFQSANPSAVQPLPAMPQLATPNTLQSTFGIGSQYQQSIAGVKGG